MWEAVITNGNRRPYSPSAQRLSKLRKQFKNKYLRRAPPGQTQPAVTGAGGVLSAHKHDSAVRAAVAAHKVMMMTAKISSFLVSPMVTTCKHEEG